MRGPLISIIVPVYNTEKYLAECLDSLVSQTYLDIEIILVNDGSSDNSRSICESYAGNDKRIRLINKRNCGAGSARNAGLRIAKGEYVLFCDSDDTIRPDTVEKVTDTAVNSGVDIVMFGAVTITESGETVQNDPYEKHNDYSAIRDPKVLFAEMKRNNEYSCCVPFMLIKRSVIRTGFIKTIHEDELFTPQVLYSADSIAYIPDICYIRKIHDDSVTTTKKSAKNLSAMLHVIAGLEKIENRDKALVSHICDLYRTINVMYSALESSEKDKVRDQKIKVDKHFIKMIIGAEAEYKKIYLHAVMSKLYHAGKY